MSKIINVGSGGSNSSSKFMKKSTYDSQNRNTDIFNYTDNKIADISERINEQNSLASSVNNSLTNKSNRALSFTLDILAADWTDNTQTILNDYFIPIGYEYLITPITNLEMYGECGVEPNNIDTNGQITINCETTPTEDITIKIIRFEVNDGQNYDDKYIGNSGFYPQIVAEVASGVMVIATNGTNTFTGISVDNKCVINVNAYGEWEVYGTYGEYRGDSVFITIDVIKQYTCTLEVKHEVFGVMWDYSNPSTALTRLTSENDPHGFVNINITEEPVVAITTSNGSSPFDDYLPWKGMEEYNIIDNEVKYKKGRDSEFSRTLYDTFVYIPEFFYKVIDDPDNSKRYWYIANYAKEDFEFHPGSNKYIAKYKTSPNFDSKSAITPTHSLNREEFRTNIMQKGDKYSILDYSCFCATRLLYLIEFADWNSQTSIGYGSHDTSLSTTGKSDIMIYHTGRMASSISSSSYILYRNIENLYGQLWEYIDGINIYKHRVYICTDFSNYIGNSIDNYIDTGVDIVNAHTVFMTKLAMSENASYIFIPSEASGSATTYIPDIVYSNIDEFTMFLTGSGYNQAYPTRSGMFSINAESAYDYSSKYYGARLMYHPN